MTKNERIVRYTAAEIDEMLRRGEDLTDWARVDAMTEVELEASIDREEEGEFDEFTIYAGSPGPGQQILIPLDQDVADWFLAQGPGYPARIKAVLRSHVEAQRAQQRDAAPEPAEPAQPAARR